MIVLLGWLLLVVIGIGHVGIHIAVYNRVNATGYPRRQIKRISKCLLVSMLAIPPLAMFLFPYALESLLQLKFSQLPLPPGVYVSVCLSSWIWLGIPWLLWRPILAIEATSAPRQVSYYQVEQSLGVNLARTTKCKWAAKLPMNQILDLAVETIQLHVRGLPPELDGYRIAHLSDIHLTGAIEPEFTAFVIERANEWNPDLFALTGDVIDSQSCIAWLYDLFSRARAADGCYCILGNHDLKVVDPGQIRQAMQRAGWTDIGGKAAAATIRGVNVELIGNEAPWFPRPQLSLSQVVPTLQSVDGGSPFRLLLSHSPDQLGWARRHGIPLMLAGHTHGGQGRLPLIGPLLGPSWHGSRYASGDFYKAPTTMHVTRGLSGTHLLRLRCAPELSLIQLRCIDWEQIQTID